MKRFVVVVTAAALLVLVAPAAASTTLTFEDSTIGSTLSGQYAGLGVVFTPNAFSGGGAPGGSWASNTDMTIVDSTLEGTIDADVGALGEPAGTVSGHVLRSFDGWLHENGDPSFSMLFSTPVSSVSVAFAGVDDPSNVRLLAYDGAVLVGTAIGSVTSGQFTLLLTAPHINRVDVAAGWSLDWVAVDNISFAPVPEPSRAMMLLLGATLLGWIRRGNRSS